MLYCKLGDDRIMKTVTSRISRALLIFVLSSFALSAIYETVILIASVMNKTGEKPQYTDLLLSLLQCALGVFAVFIPPLLRRKCGFLFPDSMYVLYLVFLYCAIFLGEVKSYYAHVPLWDDVLHGFSGVMVSLFAFMLIAVMNRSNKGYHAPPLFAAFFAFSFSVTVGALWEIYEFTLDLFLGLNMQKYRLNNGEPLVGREALFDTMKDIVIDVAGAFVATLIGYLSLKAKKGWIHGYAKKNSDAPTINDKGCSTNEK